MDDEEKRQFGIRLRKFREARGLEMKELAREIPCSYNYIRSLESGIKNPPSIKKLIRLSVVLGVSVDDLLGLGDERTALEQARLANIQSILDPERHQKVLDEESTQGLLTGKKTSGEYSRTTATGISRAEMLKGGFVFIPVIGRVPADTTRWAEWEHEDRTVPIEPQWLGSRSPDQFYVLVVSGDCLASRKIHDGSEVLIRRLDTGEIPEHNKVAVVRIGNEYTLKVWSIEDGRTRLRDGDGNLIIELDNEDDVEVMGIVVRASHEV